METKRPKRRVVQPCLEYNGGLLHKEELQLRRALYASLVESKKPQGSAKEGKEFPATEEQFSNSLEDLGEDNKAVSTKSSVGTQSDFHVKSNVKGSSSHTDNVLLNGSIAAHSKTGSSGKQELKKKSGGKRNELKQHSASKGTPNKSASNDIMAIQTQKHHILNKRKRPQQGIHYSKAARTSLSRLFELESPAKRQKREEKRVQKHVQAQRKFASSHPVNPSSLSQKQESIHLPTTRAKTESFLDFLCLRGQPCLPKELEVFNTPCAPLSPLSTDDEESSASPSLSQSAVPSPAPSSLADNPSRSSGSPSLSSVGSPANGDAPVWESGVVRMYAGGPIGRVVKGNQAYQQRNVVSPSISSDDVEEPAKAVTPPFTFRVSPRPNPVHSGSQSRNLLRPIPGPVMASAALSPAVSGDSEHRGETASPLHPGLVASGTDSRASPCSTPPPLLYIPATAQRITHLHGPPELKRCPPSTATTGRVSGGERKPGSAVDERDGGVDVPTEPPLLTKYAAPSVEHKRFLRVESKETSPPVLRKFSPCARQGLREEDVRFQQDSPRGGCPELTKFGRPAHRQPHSATERVQAWRSVAHKEIPTLSRRSFPAARHGHVTTTLPGQNVNPSKFEASSECFKGTSIPANTRGLGSRAVVLNKLESPPMSLSPGMQEHSRSSGSRQAGGPSTSDGPLNFLVAGSERGRTEIRETFGDFGAHSGPASDRERMSSFYKQSNDFHSFKTVEGQRSRMTPSPHEGRYIVDQTSFRFSPSKTSGPSHQSQVQACITTRAPMMSRTHGVSGALSGGVNGGRPHSITSPSLNSSADVMKLRSVSQPSSSSSNVLPPAWSHLEVSYASRGTPSTSRAAYPFNRVANVYTKPHPSSAANHRIDANRLSSASPVRAAVVIRSLENVRAPGAATGREAGFSRSPKAMRPAEGLSHQGGGPSRAVVGPGSLPEAFHGLHGDADVLGPTAETYSLKAPGPVETGKFVRKPDRTSVGSAVNHTGDSTSTLNAKASESQEAVVTSVKSRRGRFVGRRAKPAQTSQLAGEQRGHGKNASDSVSPGPLTKTRAERGSPGRSGPGKVDASRENPRDSLVFRPSEAEFTDPIAYIKSIQSRAERFGMCIVDPPDSWKLEFEVPENLRFSSQCQLVHRLKERWGPVERTLACIGKHLEQQSLSLTPLPQIGGYELDLPQFSKVVAQFGGMQKIIDNKKWSRVADILRVPKNAQDRNRKLEDAYCKYLLSYDFLWKEEKEELEKQVTRERETREEQGIVLESDAAIQKGRSLSMTSFQRFARNIQGRLFKGTPSLDVVEDEFWRTVNDGQHYVSVFNGLVNKGQLDSCFRPRADHPISKSGWDLNLLPFLPGSVLKHLGRVQDVTVPWLQIDMVFSANTWYSHPLALHTVDYLHTGADRIWYCVPPEENSKFVSFMESLQSRSICADDPHVPMVSPDDLIEHGLTVTRVVQKQGQFVVVFPKAFYSNLASGYALSEAVSFAPTSWLAYGLPLWQEVRDDPDWSEFAHEKLLLGLAEGSMEGESRDVLSCLLEELKSLRAAEGSALEALFALGLSGAEAIGRKCPPADEAKQALNSPWPLSDAVLYCEQCNKPCCVSAVMNETGPVVLCLRHAAVELKKESSVKDFKILSRYDVARIDTLIRKVQRKLASLQRDAHAHQPKTRGDGT